MLLSIVTTLYYSSPYIEEFYQRTKKGLEEISADYEIIFVNDGSPDDSLEVVVALHEQDKRIKIIDLSRNFGHHKAIMTGLAHARGDLVFLIDSDLEEEPELLTLFYEEFGKANADVIYGVQKKRKGEWFEQFSGKIYYFMFNLLTGYKAEANVLTARLMTRNYVQALIEHKEQEFDIMGLWSLTGFKQSAVVVNKNFKGTSAYNIRRKISLFINTVTAFSSRPLLGMFLLGLIIFGFSGGLFFLMFFIHLFIDEIEGWKLAAASVWTLGGLIIICLGTIGIYISKIYIETKRRPYTIIRKIYESEKI
ncbi:MAG: glycosyltransferase family 2 protein [Pyrinomonadaceae bacterium]|nr:glycosyltransferase family 2 protein [Pyrinomonadaceae bacterium]